MAQFQRSTVTLSSFSPKRNAPIPQPPKMLLPIEPHTSDASVLIINSSHEMAKEITLQITLQMPGCSIMYAPTVELAKLILKRRKIDIVVSSQTLPDGPVTRLKESLQELQNPPELVVIGYPNVRNTESLFDAGYAYTSMRKISITPRAAPHISTTPVIHKRRIDDSVKILGADLRNDLNNPLQEIVAMVFVAKATGQSEAAGQALEAIDKAAKNMAKVVSGLEDKIRGAVQPLHIT